MQTGIYLTYYSFLYTDSLAKIKEMLMAHQDNNSVCDVFGKSVAGLTMAETAFQELEGLNRFLGGTTPQLMIDIAKGAHDAIDNYIDRPEADKECLKAMAVIQFGSPFLFDDMTRYSKLYSPQLSDLAFDYMRGNHTQDVVQIAMALAVSILQNQHAALSGPQQRAAILEGADIEETLATFKADIETFTNDPQASSAPRLLERFTELSHQMIETIKMSQSPTPQSGPAPSP